MHEHRDTVLIQLNRNASFCFRAIGTIHSPFRSPVSMPIQAAGATKVQGTIEVCNGTPLLDIKPYVPYFNAYPEENAGWFPRTGDGADLVLSDSRFIDL